MGSKNQNSLGKQQSWRNQHFLIPKPNTEVLYSKQYGTGIRKDIQINETELRVQK